MARKSKTSGDRVANFPIDLDRLRDVVGETVFARGKRYHAEGRVEIVSVTKDYVAAIVAGSETYRTTLFPAHGNVAGECSCPAFETYGFCKHLVATALVASSSGEIDAGESRVNRISTYLRSADMETLVELILERAARDPELMAELAFAADLACGRGDEALFKEIKAQITRATRVSDYMDYDKVRRWTADIDPLLGRIEAMVEAGRTTVAIKLLDYFFDRMESALGDIDDSNGDGGALCVRAQDIHLKACRLAPPDLVTLARSLFNRETASGWDFFSEAAAVYEDVLGESGLAEYRRLAEEAWRGVRPARPAAAASLDTDFSARYRLAATLDWFAERDGDLDTRIAIRAKDRSSPHSYLEIAQLCLDHGRDAEALQWAEDGLWQFEDSPDDRLTVFTADVYRRIGRQPDADALLWRAFERSASLQLYGRLKLAAGEDGAAHAAIRDKAISVMRAQLDRSNAGERRRWQSPRDLLVQFAMQEDMLALAWETVRSHGCQEGLLMALAKASEGRHPAEALKAYAARVERLADAGGRQSYEEASNVIERMARISERIGEQAPHSRWVAELKIRHKAKRTFMVLLNEREVSVSAGPSDQDSGPPAEVSPTETEARNSRISSGSSRQ